MHTLTWQCPEMIWGSHKEARIIAISSYTSSRCKPYVLSKIVVPFLKGAHLLKVRAYKLQIQVYDVIIFNPGFSVIGRVAGQLRIIIMRKYYVDNIAQAFLASKHQLFFQKPETKWEGGNPLSSPEEHFFHGYHTTVSQWENAIRKPQMATFNYLPLKLHALATSRDEKRYRFLLRKVPGFRMCRIWPGCTLHITPFFELIKSSQTVVVITIHPLSWVTWPFLPKKWIPQKGRRNAPHPWNWNIVFA